VESLFDAAEGSENREERLAELARQVAVCTKCDLALSRTNRYSALEMRTRR
jgi:uracil-DNA glycosylase